jgi:ribose transport system substrate-binding protein
MKKLAIYVLMLLLIVVFTFTGCKTSNQQTTEATQAAVTTAVATTVAETTAAATTAAAETTVAEVIENPAIKDFIPGNVPQTGVEPPPTSKKDIKLGLAPPLSGLYHVTFYAGLKEGLTYMPEGYNVELLYQLPNSETLNAATDQINTMENWLNQGIDGIVMCPPANDAMFEPTFKKAAEQGVPVFMYGFDLAMSKNNYVTSNIGYSQVLSAKAVGEWVAKNMKDKALKIAIVSGTKSEYTDLRLQGFKEGIASHSDYEIVADQSGDWSRETSVNVTENMLSANPDINLIFAMYDEMALGAAAAVKNAGLQDNIVIVGYDTNIESYQAIKDGILQCSVYNGTKQAGIFTAEIVKEYIMDGKMVDKAYFWSPVIIDKSTVDSFDPNQLKVEE